MFTAYAAKHYFDEIHYLDIVDCNAGDHGKYFATNFNAEINIREISSPVFTTKKENGSKQSLLKYIAQLLIPKLEKESYLLFTKSWNRW